MNFYKSIKKLSAVIILSILPKLVNLKKEKVLSFNRILVFCLARELFLRKPLKLEALVHH